MKNSLKETYTANQLNTIKDAIYKISDAYYSLNSLNANMKIDRQWKGQPEMEHIVSDLKELINDGCLTTFLENL